MPQKARPGHYSWPRQDRQTRCPDNRRILNQVSMTGLSLTGLTLTGLTFAASTVPAVPPTRGDAARKG